MNQSDYCIVNVCRYHKAKYPWQDYSLENNYSTPNLFSAKTFDEDNINYTYFYENYFFMF